MSYINHLPVIKTGERIIRTPIKIFIFNALFNNFSSNEKTP